MYDIMYHIDSDSIKPTSKPRSHLMVYALPNKPEASMHISSKNHDVTNRKYFVYPYKCSPVSREYKLRTYLLPMHVNHG